MTSPTLFTRIIKGEVPCHKILEDGRFFAFLDINPIHAGHTLVIPKKEIDFLFDMDDELLGGLMVFAKKVARAIQKAVPCQRVGVMVYGLEVPHAHVHLVPVQGVRGELNFLNAKKAAPEDLALVAKKVRSFLS